MAYRGSAGQWVCAMSTIAAAALVAPGAVHAADSPNKADIDLVIPAWSSLREDIPANKINWIDLESIQAATAASQSDGHGSLGKPILTLSTGSSATLNFHARSGVIRAALTWYLD